ncbi:uncharacterized protein LOC128964932 [Oppia nitens]|uniref:uncharacterized protein LOC128964932 n=1 Tax=Oppia nitens TaxID=1686743 RepID=UPI0023DA9CD0|nr:uncharacterized protein LOC128964932 [Oppia nitens]
MDLQKPKPSYLVLRPVVPEEEQWPYGMPQLSQPSSSLSLSSSSTTGSTDLTMADQWINGWSTSSSPPSAPIRSIGPTQQRSVVRFDSVIRYHDIPKHKVQPIQPIPGKSSFGQINKFETSGRRSYQLSADWSVVNHQQQQYVRRDPEPTASRRSPFPDPSHQWSVSTRGSGGGANKNNTFQLMSSVIKAVSCNLRRGQYDRYEEEEQ